MAEIQQKVYAKHEISLDEEDITCTLISSPSEVIK